MQKKTNRVIAFLCLICMCFALSASAASFSDLDKADHAEEILKLADLKIIAGYLDGTFRPENLLRRGEFCKLAYTTQRYLQGVEGELDDLAGTTTEKNTFPDAEGHWAQPYIQTLSESGVIAGFGDGTFQPHSFLSGFEMAKMLLVIDGADPEKEGLIGATWRNQTEILARSKGLLNGYTTSLSSTVSRDLAALMIYNLLYPATDTTSSSAVISVSGNNVSVLNADGSKGTFKMTDASVIPEEGEIYYSSIVGNQITLKEIKSTGTTKVVTGKQVFWSGNKVVTMNGIPYPVADDGVLFIRAHRQGQDGKFTYEFDVYKTSSLRTTYSGIADAPLVLTASGGTEKAQIIVCDLDVVNPAKSSNVKAAYGTGAPSIYAKGEDEEIVAYPLFNGRDLEMFYVPETAPAPVNTKGAFVIADCTRQGRLRGNPTVVRVSDMTTLHSRQVFVLAEIVQYEQDDRTVCLKDSSGAEQWFKMTDDACLVFLDTANTSGLTKDVVRTGRGRKNAVYVTNSAGDITYLFVDIHGEIKG